MDATSSLLRSIPAKLPFNTAMAPNRRKQTARKVIGTSTATKSSAEKEELLKLKRAERVKARRVKHIKAKEDKVTVCSTMCTGSRRAPGSYGHVRMLIVQGNAAHPKGSSGTHGRGGERCSGQRDARPEPEIFEEIKQKVEQKVGNREFSEDDEINLEEICQCEGIPGREPENHTFVSVLD